MPKFMDIHRKMKGLTAEGLAEAHQKDLDVQGKHGVRFINYWYNEDEGAVFCLCEAPNREAAEAVHREAHGGVADEMYPLRFTGRQKPEPQCAFRTDIVAECARQKNLFDIRILNIEFLPQYFYTGAYGGLGQLQLADVPLCQDNIPFVFISGPVKDET